MVYIKWGVGDRMTELARMEAMEKYRLKDQTYFLKTMKIYRTHENAPWMIYRPKET